MCVLSGVLPVQKDEVLYRSPLLSSCCWWDSSLIWKTNWFPSVLWHCWFGRTTCKNRPRNDL